MAIENTNTQMFTLDEELALGGLGGGVTAQTATKIDDLAQALQILKCWATVDFSGKTASEGPIEWGFNRDLTVAEVSEHYTDNPIHKGDRAGEGANFPVYHGGLIPFLSTGIAASPQQLDIRHSRIPIPRWTIETVAEGAQSKSTLNFHARNMGSALTTGTIIRIQGVILGRWLRD